MAMMKAVVVHEPGAPEVLKIESLPIPEPSPGQVLIRIKASGLNRSELFTRQGHSPTVCFPPHEDAVHFELDSRPLAWCEIHIRFIFARRCRAQPQPLVIRIRTVLRRVVTPRA